MLKLNRPLGATSANFKATRFILFKSRFERIFQTGPWGLGESGMEAYKQEGAYGSYLIFILHHINQTGFIVTAGIQPVQIAGMDILGIQSSVSRQISLPLAFAKGSKFFPGRMFG